MVKRKWFWFWMVWIAVFIGAEGVALLDSDRGDTLSESIWFLQGQFWPLTAGLSVLIGWLFYHFVIDRRSRK